MLLNLKIWVDQETYERLVHEAVNGPLSIPQQAGAALRRAYGLPPHSVVRPTQNEAVPAGTGTADEEAH